MTRSSSASRYRGFRTPARTERTWTRGSPFAGKRAEAHRRQLGRTIGGQVGTITRVVDMWIHRFQ
jgi:hypothetical protein